MSEPVTREFTQLKLKDILNTLLTYRMSFADLRNMTVIELSEAIARVNSGELITYAEAEKRHKEGLKK